MYHYKLYYGSSLLRDSADIGDWYEDEDEAWEEAEIEKEDRIVQWKLDDAWHEWDNEENFDIVVDED